MQWGNILNTPVSKFTFFEPQISFLESNLNFCLKHGVRSNILENDGTKDEHTMRTNMSLFNRVNISWRSRTIINSYQNFAGSSKKLADLPKRPLFSALV